MLDAIAGTLTTFVEQHNSPLGLAALLCSALLEYVFPPFPGDTVTLFGAFLVVRHGWSLPGVFAALLAGSLIGAMGNYYVGRYLGHRYREGGVFRQPQRRALVERVLASFRRWGPAYLTINRFLPGVRAVIFLAAGMAGLKARWVLCFGALSAAVWNALILAVGYAMGANWDALLALARAYQRIAWVGLALLVAGAVALAWWRRRHGRGSGAGEPASSDETRSSTDLGRGL